MQACELVYHSTTVNTETQQTRPFNTEAAPNIHKYYQNSISY